MNEYSKFTFIGISKKPKMGGVEMGAFIVDWEGTLRRITVAVEDDLLEAWGYNKLSLRIGDYGNFPTLTQLIELLGISYLNELVLLKEEPHGYIFSRKDFLDNDGKLLQLTSIVERLKGNQFVLHRPHQYQQSSS